MRSVRNRNLQCAYLLLAVFLARGFCAAFAQTNDSTPAANTSYRQRAALGIQRLQSWYDPATGLYRTTGWWNTANAITTLADYSRVTGDKQYEGVFPNVFSAAQRKYPGFLNNFYDDEGWWALAWIDVYGLTGQRQYLRMAESIFDDMARGGITHAPEGSGGARTGNTRTPLPTSCSCLLRLTWLRDRLTKREEHDTLIGRSANGSGFCIRG